MSEQPDFSYFECEECGFSSVQRSDFKGSTFCPLCAGDSGHDIGLVERVCRENDKPEGFDARKGTRSEQEATRKALGAVGQASTPGASSQPAESSGTRTGGSE